MSTSHISHILTYFMFFAKPRPHLPMRKSKKLSGSFRFRSHVKVIYFHFPDHVDTLIYFVNESTLHLMILNVHFWVIHILFCVVDRHLNLNSLKDLEELQTKLSAYYSKVEKSSSSKRYLILSAMCTDVKLFFYQQVLFK